MKKNIFSSVLYRVFGAISGNRIGKVILPEGDGPCSHYAVVYRERAPEIRSFDRDIPVSLEISHPCASLDFRPQCATELNSARAPELAVVYGDKCNFLEIYDLSLGCRIARIAIPRARSVAYSAQGNYLACGTDSGSLRLYALSDKGERIETLNLRTGNSSIVRLCFSGHGDQLFALTAAGEVYCVSLLTGEIAPYKIIGSPHDAEAFECRAVACHRDLPLAAFAGTVDPQTGTCQVLLVDLETGRYVSFQSSQSSYIRSIRFSGGDKLMLIGESGLECWSLSKIAPIAFSLPEPEPAPAHSGLRVMDARTCGDLLVVAAAIAVTA